MRQISLMSFIQSDVEMVLFDQIMRSSFERYDLLYFNIYIGLVACACVFLLVVLQFVVVLYCR